MIEHTDHSRQPIAWLLILSAVVLAASGYAIYSGTTQTQDLRRQFAAAQQDNAALRASLADTSAQLQGAMDSLREDLSQAQKDANTGLAKAQSAATRHADIVTSQLAKKAADEAQQLSAELNKVKDSTADAAGRIDGITTDVGAVK